MIFYNTYLYFILCGAYLVYGQEFERQLESHTPCSADKDCFENSICIGNDVDTLGLCTCVKDYVIQKNRTHYQCLKEAKTLNDPCEIDVQCQVTFSNNAMCQNGKCACHPRAHFYKDKCWETVKLGDICTFSESCMLKSGNITGCVEGTCQCGILQHTVHEPDGESCEINVKLGENCTRDTQCITENSRCVNVCRCKPGFNTNYDESFCLKEAMYIGDKCSVDNQCVIEHTVCEREQCLCSQKYHSVDNNCYKDVSLNGNCQKKEECILEESMKDLIDCIDGVCSCTYQMNNEKTRCSRSSGSRILVRNFTILLIFLFWVFLTY